MNREVMFQTRLRRSGASKERLQRENLREGCWGMTVHNRADIEHPVSAAKKGRRIAWVRASPIGRPHLLVRAGPTRRPAPTAARLVAHAGRPPIGY